MTAPAVGLVAIFMVIPIGYGLYASLTTWDGFSSPEWIGLDNYIRIFTSDAVFWTSLWNTLVIATGVVLAKNVLGLGIALLLEQKLRGRGFFRSSVFAPVTISLVVAALLWTWIYNPVSGMLNEALRLIGFGGLTRSWLSTNGLEAIIIVDTWKWVGMHAVIYLAGLQAIPSQLFDAAKVDGAGAFQRLVRITLPMLKPVVAINVILSLNGAFVRNFDLVFIMTGGGPNHQTEVLLTHMVAQAFTQARLGYASALGFTVFCVVALATGFYVWTTRGLD